MSISLQTASPDPYLLDAVRNAAWDQHSTTVIADYDTADIGGAKRRWQIAFNEETGEAVVVSLDGSIGIRTLSATSVADAAIQASRF